MKIRLKATERGFIRGEFKDLYGEECSIQESSLAESPALWLGCDAGRHLDKKRAKMLIKLLKRFVRTEGLG